MVIMKTFGWDLSISKGFYHSALSQQITPPGIILYRIIYWHICVRGIDQRDKCMKYSGRSEHFPLEQFFSSSLSQHNF